MLVSLVAFLAASAAQADAAAPASPPAAAAPAAKEKKICRMDAAVIGSIAPRRTCKTKAEWDAMMGRTTGQSAPADAQRTLPSASGR